MLCDECQKNLATVHLTKIINDNMTKTHLCEDCAKKISDNAQHFSFMDIFNSLPQMFATIFSAADSSFSGSLDEEILNCPSCGTSFNDLKETGKFGCDKCYPAFSHRLEPILKRIHGNIEHRGKIPSDSNEDTKNKIKLRNLKKQLTNLVEQEAFEQAAEVRDEIKGIESFLTQNSQENVS